MKSSEKLLILTGILIVLIFLHCDILSLDHDKNIESYEIHYIISGGFAGILEETTIDLEGYSQLTDRNYLTLGYQLPDSILNELHTRVCHSGFFFLKDNYETDTPWADGFQYQITVTWNDNRKTVQTIDGAEIPNRLKRLQECLHDINYMIKENGQEIASE